MPAASDGLGLVLPHTWRPLGPRIVGAILGVGVLVLFVASWYTFPPETRAKFTLFQLCTIFFLTGLGALCMYALTRSRAVARREGLTVVNGFRKHQLAWAQIVAVRMPPGAPWVTLDLSDGTTLPLMAIQGSDGGRARVAVRQLRALAGELSR
ncbi:hypothetical protein GCM10022215_34410 [Nocardioides fonticola]|uniref:Low molecular weight protein antigen 6 PH domain-containing protein n=1 Tax=Nocardioides fonticola TaxID=450363 RepID=A0ABP7XTJ3_9ACTN